MNPYTGPISYGLRGNAGGENATWGIDPKTGKEVPVIKSANGNFLLSDLLQQYGSWDNIGKQMDVGSGANTTAGFDSPLYRTDLWNARPSNDSFSGKDGMQDLLQIGAMAAPVAAGALGGVAGTMGGAAGTADFGAGAAGYGGAGAVGADAVAGGSGADAMTGGGSTGMDFGGGLSIDEYGNVTGGMFEGGPGTAGAGGFGGTGGAASGGIFGNSDVLKSIFANRGLIGAGAGALLGGMGASSKPAGSTTSTQDIPAWLMPYVQNNLNGAQTTRDQLLANPSATGAALPEYLKTVRGDYLNPASNPYLDQTYQHAAGLVGAGVDSRFEAAGRYGSGAHQGVLQEGFNNLANNIYGGNYQAERARQASAVTGAPTFDTSSATAGFAPYAGFNGLIPGSKSTTSPYFTNQPAGILGGALAGSQIAKMLAGL